jgi:hypothetical protein
MTTIGAANGFSHKGPIKKALAVPRQLATEEQAIVLTVIRTAVGLSGPNIIMRVHQQHQFLLTAPLVAARTIRPSSLVAFATVLEMVPNLRTLVCRISSRWSSSSVSMIIS